MRILHTSDWHLGASLMNRDRRDEHVAFLDWLLETIAGHDVEILVVSGDIFDTATPPNYALSLYYNFVARLSATSCRAAVIIGGNHDSVSNLQAPREVLGFLRVHVIGGWLSNPEDHLIPVFDDQGTCRLLVAAVPYLRERELRSGHCGENWQERESARCAGVARCYAEVMAAAVEKRRRISGGDEIPILLTGHLFAAGGGLAGSERDLVIGSLGQIPLSVFPPEADYVALGHLHRMQVHGEGRIRYAGSPLPMGFDEAAYGQRVLLLNLSAAGEPPTVEDITVPRFQELQIIKGDMGTIATALREITPVVPERPVWVDVRYESSAPAGDLAGQVRQIVEDLPVEVLAVRCTGGVSARLESRAEPESLDCLSPMEVFRRLLTERFGDTSEAERLELQACFQEIYNSLVEDGEEA